ncbi:MAG: protein kinase domain-containing protein [Planktothrix sp.]
MNNDNAYYLNSLIDGKTPFRQTYLADNQPEILNPQYIIKKIVPHANPPRSFEEAKPLFQKEADLLYRLGEHPQIPEQLDEFHRDGVFYLVYERIQGESLANELKDGQPWNESRVIVLIQEILEILKFFHAVAGPHLDINPTSFIRRRSDGKLVLIDFGAVRCHELSPIKLGTLLGYMPSDTARETPGFHSDIYAVGSIAIQALTGLQPTKLQEGNSSFRWRNLAQVSDSFAATLDKMVNPYFRKRYQSADEVLKDLNKTDEVLEDLNKNQPIPQLLGKINLPKLSAYLKSPPKFISLVGVLFLIAICTPTFIRAYKDIQAYLRLEEANNFSQSEVYDKAILAAEKALSYRPNLVEAMLVQAYAIGKTNPENTEKRRQLCFAAAELQPNSAAAGICLGSIADFEGQLEVAIDYFDKVIQLYNEPNNPSYNDPKHKIDAALSIANILRRQKQYSKAKNFLTEFKDKNKDMADNFLNQIKNEIAAIDELMP